MLIPQAIVQSAGGILTQLFDLTLAGDAASIDSGAAGFSGAFDHLLVSALGRTTEVAEVSSANFRFNDDSGANYDRQSVVGQGATAAAGEGFGGTSFGVAVPGANAAASAAGAALLYLPSYSQTTFHKAGFAVAGYGEDSASGGRAAVVGFRYRSTTAISRVQFLANSGNLVAGSRLTVYGIG